MGQVVVVGFDGSARSRVAADWAAREALYRGLPLRVVHVASPPGGRRRRAHPGVPEPEPVREKEQVDVAALVAELYAFHPQLAMKAVRLTGAPGRSPARVAERVALLVLGMRGAGGFAGLRVGSVALAVAGRAAVPVVLVPSGPTCRGTGQRPGEVALGVDARRPADAAVDFAFDAACRRGARLHAVHAWRTSAPHREGVPCAGPQGHRPEGDREGHQEAQLLADVLRPWRDKYPYVRVVEEVVPVPAAEALVRVSGRSELLVVGRHGSTLGPVVRGLIEYAEGPVAVVPERVQ